MVKICIYEDDRYCQFYPLTHLRPVCLLRAGILPLIERAPLLIENSGVALMVREKLAPLMSVQTPQLLVNSIEWEDSSVLLLNGRARDFGNLPDLIRDASSSTIFKSDGHTVAVLLTPDLLENQPTILTTSSIPDLYDSLKQNFAKADTSATLYEHCWEFVADIESAIERDFALLRKTLTPAPAIIHEGVFLVKRKGIHLEDGVEVQPGALIDASGGPVLIAKNVKVESQAAVYGPCLIGQDSVVVAGKVTGSSIGPVCRVGGEVEESIFHSFVNKYHAGFIGHSYVGSWVNFGAMTTNSDLKNNYSNIRVSVNNQPIDTGSIKVGSFIGDHTKFGIGTLLNTGINIGVSCNIFGGSLVTDAEVPSFSWGNSAHWDQYRFDKAIETAQRTCGRRDQVLAESEIAVLKSVCDGDTSEEGIINL